MTYFTWESFGADVPDDKAAEAILADLNRIASEMDHEPTHDELNEIWENYWEEIRHD